MRSTARKWNDYRVSHSYPEKVSEYDHDFWTNGTSVNLLWEMEKIIITNIFSKFPPSYSSILDFACGTGRIISFLENDFSRSVGVDVSSYMLNAARGRCKKAVLIQADLTNDQNILLEKFDVITCFRFFLNAQKELQQSALHSIKSRLKKDGIFVANFHLNPLSITGCYTKIRDWQKGEQRPMMSVNDAKKLLRENGFSPIYVHGYGFLFYRKRFVPIITLTRPIEKVITRCNIFPSFGMHFLIVSKKS